VGRSKLSSESNSVVRRMAKGQPYKSGRDCWMVIGVSVPEHAGGLGRSCRFLGSISDHQTTLAAGELGRGWDRLGSRA